MPEINSEQEEQLEETKNLNSRNIIIYNRHPAPTAENLRSFLTRATHLLPSYLKRALPKTYLYAKYNDKDKASTWDTQRTDHDRGST